jgi:hypothetical protein
MDDVAATNIASSAEAMGQIMKMGQKESTGQAEKLMKLSVSLSVEQGKGSSFDGIA